MRSSSTPFSTMSSSGKNWFLFLVLLSLVTVSLGADNDADSSAYYQAGPCPTNSSLIGYTNITSMNEDVFSHFEDAMNFGSPSVTYTYILCPETTFTVVDTGDFIIPATDETTFSCGWDGAMENNCVINGGAFQVYFLDLLELKDIRFQGLTFQNGELASVYGDAHPNTMVYFENCLWRNFNTTITVYIHHTPYQPYRRLTEGGDKYNFERPAAVQKYENVVEKYENVVNKKKEERNLQIEYRYSMGVIFRDCTFQGLTNIDSIIFNVGGQVGVVHTMFMNNVIDNYALFTTVVNGHVYVAGDTVFINNTAPLGPVFVSYDSFLQYSDGATGQGNTGGACESIYIENMVALNGPSCILGSGACQGDCCAFTDVTCDYNPDPVMAPPVSPSQTNAPTVSAVTTLTSIQPDPASSDEEPMQFSQIQDAPLVEDSKSGGCTGFCLAFFAIAGTVVLGVLVTMFIFVRRKRQRRTLTEETQKAAAAEDVNSGMVAEGADAEIS